MVCDRTEQSWGALLSLIQRGSLGIIRRADDTTVGEVGENRAGIEAGPRVEKKSRGGHVSWVYKTVRVGGCVEILQYVLNH